MCLARQALSGVRVSGLMGPLQLMVTWYKTHLAGEQVAHLDIQNKATSSSTNFNFSLFWMLQCVACSPARWILYHVTVSWKGPIN